MWGVSLCSAFQLSANPMCNPTEFPDLSSSRTFYCIRKFIRAVAMRAACMNLNLRPLFVEIQIAFFGLSGYP